MTDVAHVSSDEEIVAESLDHFYMSSVRLGALTRLGERCDLCAPPCVNKMSSNRLI